MYILYSFSDLWPAHGSTGTQDNKEKAWPGDQYT